MSAVDSLFSMVRERSLGFSWRETMSGYHEFVGGAGPVGRHPLAFSVTCRADHLSQLLNPFHPDWCTVTVDGRVSVGGWGEGAPCHGRMELRYLKDRTLRYDFEFSANGGEYRFIGEKVNIWPWNLPVSHTTCFGTIVETSSGKLVSRSTTFFRWWQLPGFLGSMRLS